MWTLRTRMGWGLMLLGALLVTLASARYFTLNPLVYFPRQREVYDEHTLGLMLHITGMMFALTLGPLQFLRSFRDRYPRVHRATGRVYLTGALLGGLAGLYMAQYAASGIVARTGFAFLAMGVLVTGAAALARIRAGRVQSHREWMTRNYAFILAAVTLRLYLPFTEAWLGEHDGYALVAWLCWVPNAVIAELMVRGHLRTRPESTLLPA